MSATDGVRSQNDCVSNQHLTHWAISASSVSLLKNSQCLADGDRSRTDRTPCACCVTSPSFATTPRCVTAKRHNKMIVVLDRATRRSGNCWNFIACYFQFALIFLTDPKWM